MGSIKGMLKSKTFWFNTATLILDLSGQLSQFVPPGTATTVVTIVNIVLRSVTSKSWADKA